MTSLKKQEEKVVCKRGIRRVEREGRVEKNTGLRGRQKGLRLFGPEFFKVLPMWHSTCRRQEKRSQLDERERGVLYFSIYTSNELVQICTGYV